MVVDPKTIEYRAGDIVMSPDYHGKRHFRVLATHAKVFLHVEDAQKGKRANIPMSDAILVNASERPYKGIPDAALSVLLSRGREEAVREYVMRVNVKKDNYKLRK